MRACKVLHGPSGNIVTRGVVSLAASRGHEACPLVGFVSSWWLFVARIVYSLARFASRRIRGISLEIVEINGMRKFLFTFGALFLFSLALPALASAPDVDTKYTAAYVRANVVKDKTTASEVKERLGKPANVSRTASDSGDAETWIYHKSSEGSKGFFSSLSKRAGGALNAIGRTSAGSSAISPVRDAQATAGNAQYTSDEVKQAVGPEDSNGDDTPYSTISIQFRNGIVTGYILE
jgi:hypothetical protein